MKNKIKKIRKILSEWTEHALISYAWSWTPDLIVVHGISSFKIFLHVTADLNWVKNHPDKALQCSLFKEESSVWRMIKN